MLALNFRDNELEFTVKPIKGGKDKSSKSFRSDIDVNIYGADTESVIYEDSNGQIYEPQCSTLASPNGNDYIIWHSPKAIAFHDFLSFFLSKHAIEELANGNKKCIIYYHNLEYDWLQLIKQKQDLLTMTKTGMYSRNSLRQKTDLKTIESLKEDKDYFLGIFSGYPVFLKDRALFVGSAPHFTVRVFKTKNKWFDIQFLDTFSFFKGSLANVAKELNLKLDKMDRQEDLGKVDYRLLPDHDENKQYFVKYALIDSRVTQEAGEAIRALHIQAGFTKFRVSSPSFAVQYLFQCLEEGNTVLSGTDNQAIMQLIIDTYRGGRTGGIAHGKIHNISVLDFASSYPTAMLSIPSFSPSMQYINVPNDMLSDIHGILRELENNPNCFIRVSGEELDKHYPALIAHNKKTKKLTPIYGKFENIATTGYELLGGIKSGTLKISKIHELVILKDTDKKIQKPFKDFAQKAYKGKQDSIKGSILYVMWKLILNGAYGKLIESRKKINVSVEHAKDTIPFHPAYEKELHVMFYDEYIRCMRDSESWEETYLDLCKDVYENFPQEEIQHCLFEDINIGSKNFGSYAVPAGASLITGIARARLRALMKCTEALYWDTDSVFIPDLDFDKLKNQLELGNSWLPSNVHPLQLGEQLGDLDCELLQGTGYLAGTKRYYIQKDTGKRDENQEPIIKVKKAIHGLPSLPQKEVERMIKYLATNEGVGKYSAKEKPLKSKEAPNARLIGAFLAKEKQIESLYKKDDRLDWEYDEKLGLYKGEVKTWKTLQ